jgi:hypothetical protein
MKWYEILVDDGDGSSHTVRFTTEDKARSWLTSRRDYPGEEDCYPYSAIMYVDTTCEYFFSDDEGND